MLVARVWPLAPEWLRLGLGTGLLGSFTTFSAVVASAALLTDAGQPLLAVLYVAITLVAGVGAAFLGLRVGRRPVPPIGAEE
jgi:CrcB protein